MIGERGDEYVGARSNNSTETGAPTYFRLNIVTINRVLIFSVIWPRQSVHSMTGHQKGVCHLQCSVVGGQEVVTDIPDIANSVSE